MSDKDTTEQSHKYIFHVAMPADLKAAQSSNVYKAPSLDTEGFIHCCLAEQLDGVLERYFSGVSDYQVIRIDVTTLDKDLKPVYENTVGGEELFPHIYGELPVASYQLEESR